MFIAGQWERAAEEFTSEANTSALRSLLVPESRHISLGLY
jgi:hypothetical protein